MRESEKIMLYDPELLSVQNKIWSREGCTSTSVYPPADLVELRYWFGSIDP